MPIEATRFEYCCSLNYVGGLYDVKKATDLPKLDWKTKYGYEATGPLLFGVTKGPGKHGRNDYVAAEAALRAAGWKMVVEFPSAHTDGTRCRLWVLVPKEESTWGGGGFEW